MKATFARMRTHLAAATVALLLFAATPLGAQDTSSPIPTGKTRATPRVNPADPCCGITAIDARSGLVTAQDSTTGRSFRFRVTDPMLLRSLTVGQKVFADHRARRVSVHPSDPCCAIVGPVEPVNGTITAIDLRTGVVTARGAKSGRTFRFKVADAALLRGLDIGQAVWADHAAKAVGIKPGELCCNIVDP